MALSRSDAQGHLSLTAGHLVQMVLIFPALALLWGHWQTHSGGSRGDRALPAGDQRQGGAGREETPGPRGSTGRDQPFPRCLFISATRENAAVLQVRCPCESNHKRQPGRENHTAVMRRQKGQNPLTPGFVWLGSLCLHRDDGISTGLPGRKELGLCACPKEPQFEKHRSRLRRLPVRLTLLPSSCDQGYVSELHGVAAGLWARGSCPNHPFGQTSPWCWRRSIDRLVS